MTPYLSFRRRLISGKSIVLSTLLYGAELWGPAITKRQMGILQAAQNWLAKWIAQSNRETSTQEDRDACGMMTIYQIIIYKVICLGLSVMKTEKPDHLFRMLKGKTTETMGLRRSERKKIEYPSQGYFLSKSWKNTFSKYFNCLPKNLQEEDPRRPMIKKILKDWSRHNVEKTPS